MSPVTKTCPDCHSTMRATELEPKRQDLDLAVNGAVPSRLRLPVWRCETCGTARPRLE